VAVEGRLEIRDYETTAGERRRAVEVVADNIRFLDRKPVAEAVEEEIPDFEPPLEEDEEVPF
jgi:single-strand DNA-binding protein